ncbi:serine hydrolase domain-containing protein [Allosalinactinospora lopnorensis]|uniref:serine hydrolase domain-containing protein n=1 Tax=Allosalinactinospora lopnorensis TaxID=1352348 RepID=UPI000697287D|nr:serine hydrolase domain-containing protein [Allosalinactinospora lopnorensis]
MSGKDRRTGGAAIAGTTERRFAKVREVFAENFDSGDEVGAAFCVYERGRPVIDLWGGCADPRTGRQWEEDTTAIIYSATKGVTAGIVLHLVDEGLLDLDARVADYWPEFAAGGKERITLKHLLTHRAGLPAVDRPITLAMMEAWHPVVDALAAQRPAWEPDTAHGYHALTFGWLLGEVVRRATGRTPGQYLREKVAPSLRLDLRIGTPPEQEHRFAPTIPPREIEPYPDKGYEEFIRQLVALAPARGTGERALKRQQRFTTLVKGPARDLADRMVGRLVQRRVETLAQRTFATVMVNRFDMNTPRLHALEMPAGNAICTARGLARYYATLGGEVDGRRLLSPGLAEQAAQPWSRGPDRVLLSHTAFGLGFMVPSGPYFDGWGYRTFGHQGSGGALGFADLDNDLAFGYVLNKHCAAPRNPRAEALVRAVYACLA